MNSIVLVGNIGQNPESRKVGDYTKVSFSLATTRMQKGEKVTDWHNVEAWGKTAEAVARYATKGMKVAVSGSLIYETWIKEDKSKAVKAIIRAERVDFLSSKAETQGAGEPAPQPSKNQVIGQSADYTTPQDGDLPF